MKKKKINLLIYLALFSGLIVMALPFYWMIITAFKPPWEAIQYPPTWIPHEIDLTNIVKVWGEYFDRYYLNSVIVACSVTVFVLFTSSLAGFIFAKYDFAGKELLFLLVLSTMMIPFQVIMISLFMIMMWLHWIDRLRAMIVPGMVSAFGIFLMRQFISTIPNDLLDAARIDGYSDFGIYFRLIIPNIKPVLSALAIFTFMWSWNDFLWPLVITNSIRSRTLTVGLAMYTLKWWTQYNLVMAGSLLVIGPVVIVFLILQKKFVTGITLSGMKF
ncbi:L-arabinose transport system permease protein AraQ [subsurface metagenome]